MDFFFSSTARTIIRGVFALALAPSFAADGIDLSGTVFEASGKGAFGIQVGLRNSKVSTITAPDGSWKIACATCPLPAGGDSLELKLRDSVLEVVHLSTLTQSGLVRVLGEARPSAAQPVAFSRSEIAQHQADQDFVAINNGIQTMIEGSRGSLNVARGMKTFGWIMAGAGAATIGYAMSSDDDLTRIIAGGIGGGFAMTGAITLPLAISSQMEGENRLAGLEREGREYPKRRNAAKNLEESRWIDSAQNLRTALVFQSSLLEERRRMTKIGLAMAALGTGGAIYGASLFSGVGAIAGATPGGALGFSFLVVGLTSAADPGDLAGTVEKTRTRILKMQEDHPFLVQPGDSLLVQDP